MDAPRLITIVWVFLAMGVSGATGETKLKALIVDGQNNHQWKVTTPVLIEALQWSERFTIDVATSPPAKHENSQFRPKFGQYDVVISNYNGEPWCEAARNDFEAYVRGGGGFVSVHAADNAFPDWSDYNEMIGLGGWGGRNEKSGPYVYYRDGQVVRDTSAGRGGHHGPQHEFVVETRAHDHPVMAGLPTRWLHAKDELYSQLRGPGKNMTILATAYAAADKGGTARDEPMLMAIDYGQGRVFHTALGHADYSMRCLGFYATLARGAEWAATGEVTIAAPAELASDTQVVVPAQKEQEAWLEFPGGSGPGAGKKVVLISGDEEYRSEEALPQLAKILSEHHGYQTTVLFAIEPQTGEINPDIRDSVPGIEALDEADLLVLALRFRNYADEAMEHIDRYVQSGKPIIGMRTATHAFNIPADRKYARYSFNSKEWDGGFGRQLLGETWISHHGAHGKQSCRGILAEQQEAHPILRGIEDGQIWGPTDVYGVRLPLPDGCIPLVYGQVVEGMEEDDPPLSGAKNDPMMPIAWIRDVDVGEGKTSRVFTTTMGSSTDLANQGLRQLLVQAAYWCTGLESQINGTTEVSLVGEFAPTPFGFGGFIKGRFPSDYR